MMPETHEYYPLSAQFSRQQVHERTGVADDVLAFWIKQELLVPTPAPPRAHRRFSYEQLHIAVVLDSMRSLGANVGVLRKFASFLQEGVKVVREAGFDRSALRAAADLRSILHQFDSGFPVKVYYPSVDGQSERIATSEEEVVKCWLAREQSEGANDAVASFGKGLSIRKARALSDALTLISSGHLTHGQTSPTNWVAWIDRAGEPQFAYDNETILETEEGPTAAFYISLSKLILKLWPDRLAFAREGYERERATVLSQHLAELEKSNPNEALRLRTRLGWPENWVEQDSRNWEVNMDG